METFQGRDVVLYIESHQCQVDSAYHTCPCSEGGNRGSGGVALLFKRELSHVIQIVRKDEYTTYMWIRVKTGETRYVYIAICYFSDYAQEWLPYDALYDDIVEFTGLGIR